MEFESGILDLQVLFEQSDHAYNDQNYINGILIRCFEGFSKFLMNKIWNVFNDTHLAKSLYNSSTLTAKNEQAAEICQDLFSFHQVAQKYANSKDAESMLGINAVDSIL